MSSIQEDPKGFKRDGGWSQLTATSYSTPTKSEREEETSESESSGWDPSDDSSFSGDDDPEEFDFDDSIKSFVKLDKDQIMDYKDFEKELEGETKATRRVTRAHKQEIDQKKNIVTKIKILPKSKHSRSLVLDDDGDEVLVSDSSEEEVDVTKKYNLEGIMDEDDESDESEFEEMDDDSSDASNEDNSEVSDFEEMEEFSPILSD